MPRRDFEKQVLSLLAKHPLTFAQVGEMFGVSKQYVHQVYKRAVAEGRKSLDQIVCFEKYE